MVLVELTGKNPGGGSIWHFQVGTPRNFPASGGKNEEAPNNSEAHWACVH
jgi:hypothetical protein